MRLLELSRHQHIELGHDETAAAHIHRDLLVIGPHHEVLRQGIILVGLRLQRDALSVEGFLFLHLYPTVFGLHHLDLALHQMGTAILEVVQGVFVLGIQLQRHLIYIKGIIILVLRQQTVAHVEHCIRLQLGIGRHLHHLLKSGVGTVVLLQAVIGITQVKNGLGVVWACFDDFLVFGDGLRVVRLLVLAVALTNGLLVVLCRNCQRRR